MYKIESLGGKLLKVLECIRVWEGYVESLGDIKISWEAYDGEFWSALPNSDTLQKSQSYASRTLIYPPKLTIVALPNSDIREFTM